MIWIVILLGFIALVLLAIYFLYGLFEVFI